MTHPAADFEFTLNELTRRMRRVYDRIFREVGVSSQQAAVLLFLERFGAQSQNDLSERMELGKAATAALLARMEALGWVSRIAPESDRRVRVVSMTPAAHEIVTRIETLGRRLGRQLRAGLSDADQRAALSVLDHMRANLRGLEEDGLA